MGEEVIGAAACLLVLGAPQGVTRAELLGKSPDQVIRMGKDKWFEFHGSKKGESTADMIDAAVLWGKARKAMNDRLVRDLTPGRKKAVAEMRKQMAALHVKACDLGYIWSGGGTIWNPIYASAAGDAEDALVKLLRGQPAPRTKPFDEAWKGVQAALAGKKADIDSFASAAGGYADGVKRLNEMNVIYGRLMAPTSEYPGSASHMRAFAVKRLEIPGSMSE